MMVADQHLPLLAPARDTVSDDFASVFEPGSRAGAPKDIGPSIDRIGQQPMNRMVARRAPLHGPAVGTIDGNRQVNPLLPQPQGELAHAANLVELAEHQRQRLTDPPVRVLFQAIISAAPVANRDRRVQIAARCFQAQRLLRTLLENRQLELAEGAFQAKQQPVVDQSRIVDAVFVDDQAVHEGAEFQERVPIAPVACQPRRLDRQHGAGLAGADRREQTLEAGTELTTARPTEIIVDDNDVLPAERARSRHQGVLPTSALRVVEQLIRRRLPDVDVSVARQMLRRNLIHCWPRPAAPCRRRCAPPSAALLPPESVVVSGCARARWPRARADRAAGGRLVAPSSHFPLIMLENDKDRGAPLIALRSPCSASSVRRGISIIVSRAAQGSVIQAGNSARVLSGCSITKWMLPPWCNRRTTTTRSPARGCIGYWIRTSKGCSWAVCRRLEGHHERARVVAVPSALTGGAAPEGQARRAFPARSDRLREGGSRSHR